MKNEQLKGKYEEYAVGLWWDKIANQRLTQEANEVLDDVKSAVQGLLEEVENRIKELDRYEKMGFTKQFCANRRDEIRTYIIPLIKKWFADVIP